ncbi:MAG: hypothetical protein R6X28_12840 [Bacteroidales bacterium]
MEDSKACQKVIDLGRTIVKELKLDPGVDTLAKWIAHYVAEKIELTEKLTGDDKSTAEKECFEDILKLWQHRWSLPREKPFLKDFEPLFETLEKLNPNMETAFFLPPEIQFEFNSENNKEDTNEVESHFDTALRVDRLARSLICNLLHQAVSGLELTEERGKLIRNAIDLIDYHDTKIIRFISNYDVIQEVNEDDEAKKRINELQKKKMIWKNLLQ